jgi:hypothetical protein
MSQIPTYIELETHRESAIGIAGARFGTPGKTYGLNCFNSPLHLRLFTLFNCKRNSGDAHFQRAYPTNDSDSDSDSDSNANSKDDLEYQR